ncbi:hypothetical protein D3C81_1782910 [compost metagenome]
MIDLRGVGVDVGVDMLKPLYSLAAYVVPVPPRLFDVTAAADADVHPKRSLRVLLDQFQPGFGQSGAHWCFVELLVMREVLPAVLHRRR